LACCTFKPTLFTNTSPATCSSIRENVDEPAGDVDGLVGGTSLAGEMTKEIDSLPTTAASTPTENPAENLWSDATQGVAQLHLPDSVVQNIE